MTLSNKSYDVVDENENLLYRGFAQLFVGDQVQMRRSGPFGSGAELVLQSQLRPFNSVKDHSKHECARTALFGLY
jgi:hypothetical protein